jgi:hypothetical protein
MKFLLIGKRVFESQKNVPHVCSVKCVILEETEHIPNVSRLI